jgi:hypothetical protein
MEVMLGCAWHLDSQQRELKQDLHAQLPSMDPREGRPDHGGRDRHLAVTVADIDVLVSSSLQESLYHFHVA